MNYFAVLFLVVVGVSVALASGGKTVLSMALDLLPDLQAVLASAPPVEGVERGNVNGISRAFTVFLPIVRQALKAQADQEKREVDPATIDTLDRVQRLIPGVVNLIDAASSGSPLGIDLEFALPDFTGQILGAAEAGDAPPVQNDLVTDPGASFITPPVPKYSAAPVPTYVAAQVLPQPGSTTYTVPSVPLPHSSPASEASLVNLQAPAAGFYSQFQYDAAFNAAKERGTQQTPGVSSDGTVHYVLPGGGFFYSTGY